MCRLLGALPRRCHSIGRHAKGDRRWRRDRRLPSSPLRDFLASEAAGGIVLIVAAAAAMLAANLPATAHAYHPAAAYRDRAGARRQARADERASVDQRRADGGVLPARRAGDQARVRSTGGWRAGSGGDCRRSRRRRGWSVPAIVYLAITRGDAGAAARAGRSRRRPTSPLRSACWRCSAAARRPRSSCS